MHFNLISMRRDTIFYRIFAQSPTILFELLSQPPNRASEYRFDSVEVKETSFRIDGVFLPPDRTGTVFFCEVQFQLDELLYERMISEISIYTYRRRSSLSNWRAVAIYPSRNIEQSDTSLFEELLASGRITPIYLDELGDGAELPTGLGLIVLTTLEGDAAVARARQTIEQSRLLPDGRAILELVSTIMVYKFGNLTRDEVNAMFGIELEQTRVYQDAKAEGKAEEGRSLVLKLLTRKLGRQIDLALQSRVNSLTIEQIESLGEALLDFQVIDELVNWLDNNR
jgi:predicted transposase/invertase (TIGR01784 family)